MTASSLRALTRKALAAHAKKHQIAGWHEMTKDELVAALAEYFRRIGRNGANRSAGRGRREPGSIPSGRNTASGSSALDRSGKPPHRTVLGHHPSTRRLLKPAVTGASAPQAVCDSLIAEALDPCWIHVRWTLSRGTLHRAEAALGTQWHQAVPVLRILDVTSDDTGPTSQTRLRDVEIHGDVDHWYLPVVNGPRTYKVQIGYRAASGLVFVMAQSNRIHMPRPESHSLKERSNGRKRNGPQASVSPLELEKKPSYDLRAYCSAKPVGTYDVAGTNGRDETQVPAPVPVELRLHTELILHGSTDPHAELKLLGVQVPVSRDGTFSHRLALPDGRQVIDAVVTTRDGCHQRTVVVGIERNTKELEPLWFDDIEP